MTRVTAMPDVRVLLGVKCGTVIPAPDTFRRFSSAGIKGAIVVLSRLPLSSYLFVVKGSWKQPKLSLSI